MLLFILLLLLLLLFILLLLLLLVVYFALPLSTVVAMGHVLPFTLELEGLRKLAAGLHLLLPLIFVYILVKRAVVRMMGISLGSELIAGKDWCCTRTAASSRAMVAWMLAPVALGC